ncbi:MAG: hypothetical protein GXY17_01880 [Clostridiaceae bacterium]|nr:hypothetical protein [Clostridiaceae bacterium]
MRWVRHEENGPSVPEDGKFTIDWSGGTPPNGGVAPVVKYTIEGGSEITPGTCSDATEVTIIQGADLTISYTPPKESGAPLNFWGMRVTKQGEQNATDVVQSVQISMNLSGKYENSNDVR